MESSECRDLVNRRGAKERATFFLAMQAGRARNKAGRIAGMIRPGGRAPCPSSTCFHFSWKGSKGILISRRG